MDPALQALAESVGVLTKYHDWKGRLHENEPEAIVQVLQTLGIEISGARDAGVAAARLRRSAWQELVPPCAVAWDGGAATLYLRLPASETGAFAIEIRSESGDTRRVEGRLGDVHPRETATVDGQTFALRGVQVHVGGHGYYRATVHAAGRTGACLIIAAPLSAYQPPRSDKLWGVFTPLYALHREAGTGIGDLADLQRLSRWVGELGGSFVGTLPLLATFLDEPCEYSPYGPVSRMFWNELYLDLDTAPGLARSPGARAALASADFTTEASALRSMPLVEYRRQMALRRAVLDRLSEAAWQSDGLRQELETFLARKQRAGDYARFRAVTEAQRKVWRDWPAQQRDGQVGPGDYDERARRYHVYVQYAMEEQLARLSRDGVTLYLDLPVGVHRYGYDTWRDREVFALSASAGAPPDELFSEGQDWGAAPLHPWSLRRTGYRYFIDAVRAHFEHAGMLRIDHAMGLHRMYWVPEGFSARDGVYVHYNAGEMYAILSLESHRHGCAVTGEDLGTVPDYVRPSMKRHGLSRLYVGQFSLYGSEHEPIVPPPVEVVASINTHDTPTWAGFWEGRDIDDRVTMGLIDEHEAAAERESRQETIARTVAYLRRRGLLAQGEERDPAAVMRAFTRHLAGSEAELVIVTLEDLWLEPLPQNVPGTGPDERPNWRRKMGPILEAILADAEVQTILEMVNQDRRRAAEHGG